MVEKAEWCFATVKLAGNIVSEITYNVFIVTINLQF